MPLRGKIWHLYVQYCVVHSLVMVCFFCTQRNIQHRKVNTWFRPAVTKTFVRSSVLRSCAFKSPFKHLEILQISRPEFLPLIFCKYILILGTTLLCLYRRCGYDGTIYLLYTAMSMWFPMHAILREVQKSRLLIWSISKHPSICIY